MITFLIVPLPKVWNLIKEKGSLRIAPEVKMGLVKRCWAPCFTINSGFLNLPKASFIISWYTAVLHILVLFYALYILMGGRSDTFFSPIFEFNRYGMNWISAILVVYCLFFIICCSFGLIHGIRSVRH